MFLCEMPGLSSFAPSASAQTLYPFLILTRMAAAGRDSCGLARKKHVDANGL
jgi:hypothetical protein